jgi:hypothetical protein
MPGIDSEFLASGLPSRWQHHVAVCSPAIPEEHVHIAWAFWEAASRLDPCINHPKRLVAIFGEHPFMTNVGNGILTFSKVPDAVNAYVEGFAFFDIPRMLNYAPKLIVATILEELVHCMMNVRDEVLVKHMVAAMYPGVGVIQDGCYAQRAEPETPFSVETRRP